jgi:hypothetical protein
MIHKSLQADIVGEDGLGGLTDTAVARGRVRGRGVEFGEEETGLRATGVTDDESGQGEAVLDEFLRGKGTGQRF